MNNLPLQPLVWKDLSHGDVCVVRVDTPMYDYAIMDDSKAFKIGYYNLQSPIKYATGFATIDEAKQWAWSHYNEKMQPYVKPMPTWIDVNEREPTEKGDYLIRDYQGRVAMGKYDKGFYMESGGEKWGCVQFWMPTPEFSTMQNLHKGE